MIPIILCKNTRTDVTSVSAIENKECTYLNGRSYRVFCETLIKLFYENTIYEKYFCNRIEILLAEFIVSNNFMYAK